jgi:hypothetical protein
MQSARRDEEESVNQALTDDDAERAGALLANDRGTSEPLRRLSVTRS